ncbi:MAG: DUF4058 family protein [Planctomycetaceae bacterium]|nr:MAG: DUF4058 family protein [Planctomycetaceae bacterium]
MQVHPKLPAFALFGGEVILKEGASAARFTEFIGRRNNMPIHDWTRVDAGLFHHFHQQWATYVCNALNSGKLPPDYFALVEQNIRGPIPAYLRKASSVTVRHRHGDVVAVLEIISPGNKASRAEFQALVQKSATLLRQGVHLLVIDLFPPGKRDPQGIHKAIWDEFEEQELELPADKPLTLAAYDAGPECVAYVEFVGVGDSLPEMPLFLRPEFYVPTPLEDTYQTAWAMFPATLQGLLTAS